jgi:hypothetical protein
MSEPSEIELRRQLLSIGILSYQEQDTVLSIARRCSGIGVATGAGWAVVGAPALGPGVLAGFLSGFITGTAACTALNLSQREALRKLASE